jgi:ribosomal protein L40E
MGFGLGCTKCARISPRFQQEQQGIMMIAHCHECGSRNLRPSHFLMADLAYLLVLRSPVRCRTCRKRFHVSIFSIGKIQREAEARRDHEVHEEHKSRAANPGWQTFNDQK